VNRSVVTAELSPPGVTTRTATEVPAIPAGLVTVSRVPPASTTTVVPETVPNVTLITVKSPLPVMLTRVPPAAGPLVGEIEDTTGTGTVYRYTSALVAAVVPPGVVTEIATVPAACGGAVALMVVAERIVNVAGTVPNRTAVAPVVVVALSKLAPWIVTVVPPNVVPVCGVTALIDGGAGFS
jgi:hypothetical protein